MEYHSPAEIKINIDLSPKAVIEALQMLCDMFFQRKTYKQLKEAEVIKAYINNLGQSFALIEKLTPEQKDIVSQSLTNDILRLVRDQTLEISLLFPHAGLLVDVGREVNPISFPLEGSALRKALEAEALKRKLVEAQVH